MFGGGVPEVRMAPKWASGRLAVDRFIQKLEESVSLMSEGGVALRSGLTSAGRRLRTNFPRLMGRRVRELNLAVDPKQCYL